MSEAAQPTTGVDFSHPERISGVYALIARSGSGVYVGSSCRALHRIDGHLTELSHGTHYSSAMQTAWNAGERFDAVILEQCDRTQCPKRELAWIDRLGPLFNSTRATANAGKDAPYVSEANRKRTGKPWTPRDRTAWLAKLSARKTGQRFGPRPVEVGQKIAASLRGHPLSLERREKISLAHKRFHERLRAQGLVQRRPRRAQS